MTKRSKKLPELRKKLLTLERLEPNDIISCEAPQQPFDRLLLKKSPIYRRSRELFLQQSGRLEPAFLSSQRSLSGSILIENRIQYSPIADELRWITRHSLKPQKDLFNLRPYTTSLFHEQNHRILWNFLPSTPNHASSIRRYLNYVESLVVVTDMALSDSLDLTIAEALYLIGSIYDPGTPIRKTLPRWKNYENYLLATLHATYLNLELYSAKDIHKILAAIYGTSALTERACSRALNLDRQFVVKTNPAWQMKNQRKVRNFLNQKSDQSLRLPDDPFQYGISSYWAQKWFAWLNLQ